MDPREDHNFMAYGQTHELNLRSKGDGHGVFGLGLGCKGLKRGTQSHGNNEAHRLNFGSKGDGQGIFSLGLQWIKERDTIS